MNLYKNLAKFYDLLYSYRDYDCEADFLIKNIPTKKTQTMLDVACGTGVHLEAIRKKLPSAKLTGIDLNGEMLNVAREKSLDARLVQADMREFNLGKSYNLVYCLSSSIQYNLSTEDFEKTIDNMRNHAIGGKVIFDLAYCTERWKEGYTNITANSTDRFDIAELYTSHSSKGFSYWNPLYLIKDRHTGKLDMHVDKHKIKLWGISEVSDILSSKAIPFELKMGFSGDNKDTEVPIFVLEGIKN